MSPELDSPREAPQGVPNFRDLGGLPADGGSIRTGALFRAEAPSGLTADGIDVVGRLGLRLVCDLRGPQEREKAPGAWPGTPAPRLLQRADGARDPAADAFRAYLARGEHDGGEAARAYMLHAYAQLPAALPPLLRPFLDDVLDGEVPALVHCAAGKDRTGVAVALILTALGVPRAAIERDYLASNEGYGVARIIAAIERGHGATVSSETAAAIACRPEYLARAFAAAEQQDGTMDAYLERRLGLDLDRRAALRAALTVDEPSTRD